MRALITITILICALALSSAPQSVAQFNDTYQQELITSNSKVSAYLQSPVATPLDHMVAHQIRHQDISGSGSETAGLMLDCSGTAPCRWVHPGLTPALQTNSYARNRIESPNGFVGNRMNPSESAEQEAGRRISNYVGNRIFNRLFRD